MFVCLFVLAWHFWTQGPQTDNTIENLLKSLSQSDVICQPKQTDIALNSGQYKQQLIYHQKTTTCNSEQLSERIATSVSNKHHVFQ